MGGQGIKIYDSYDWRRMWEGRDRGSRAEVEVGDKREWMRQMTLKRRVRIPRLLRTSRLASPL